MKTTISVLAIGACLGLSGCDNLSNKATPERLDTLRREGVDEKKRQQAEANLAKTLDRANSIAGLNADLGGSTVGNPQTMPLNTLLRASLEHNPDISRAVQGINKADAQRLRAVFGYLPQLSYALTQSDVTTEVVSSDNEVFELGSATYPVEMGMLELRQPLIDMSRVYGIKLASTARTASEVRYLAAVQAALYETFDAYLIGVQSQLKMDELDRRAQSLGRQAGAESALAETGLADETAQRSLLTEQAQAESDLSIETTRYNEALARLAYLSGQAVSGVQPVSVPAGIRGTERRIPLQSALEAAQKNNPEMLVTAIGVVQSDLGRKQALAADFGPVLDFFMTMEDESREGSRFGGGSVTAETITGLRVTLPIFNARGDGLRTLDANVDLRGAVVDYHATRRKLETDISMTLERMKQLSHAIDRLSSASAAASANLQAEQTRFANGESSELAVLARERLAGEMRMEAEVQKVEYLRSWVKLQYLTGAMSVDVLG